jgi:uncharacterized glyoxalase superfamily protein PhnB
MTTSGTAAERVTFTGVVLHARYEDANAMLDWFSRVFGFEERARYVDKDGRVQQAEMLVGDTELWFSGHGPGYWDGLGHRPDEWLLVLVDDVDALAARVEAAGVELERPPADQDYGVRNCAVVDPEGYHWSFMRKTGKGYVQTQTLEEGGLEEVLPG